MSGNRFDKLAEQETDMVKKCMWWMMSCAYEEGRTDVFIGQLDESIAKNKSIKRHQKKGEIK